MRKTIFILSIIGIALSLYIFCGAAAQVKVTKVLLGTPVYSEPNFESEKVLEFLKQNEVVTVKKEVTGNDNNLWLQISYNDLYEGYIPKGYVYLSANSEDYNFLIVKVTGKTTYEAVNVYLYYDEGSAIAGTLYDGQTVVKIDDESSYGEFNRVLYNGKYCYIKKENLTSGLTYSQKIAIVLSSVLLVVLIGLGFAYYKLLGYKRRRYLAQ